MIKTMGWKTVRADLERRRAALAAEIGAYPMPITACDAQFNHLIDRRRLIANEIARLDKAMRSPGGSVAAFIRASPLLDDGISDP